jgi:iron complex outermembrane receptor protein
MRSFAAGLSLAFFLAPAFSEDAVVVEATRFPEDVRRLPASVTVISSEDIEKSAARTLPELLNGQVGFTVKDLFGNNASTTSIDLRGYGVTGPQNTLILLDGRRVSDFDLSGVQWAAIPIASVERIEILRGTGAVLYGDAASAGVVNIVTRSPLKEGRDLELFGRVASYGTFEGQAYGSAASGGFGVNGSVYGYTSQGYRLNNRNEQQNNTLNLRWALGEGALDFRFGNDRQYVRLPGGRFIQPSIGLDEYAANPTGTDTPLDYAYRDGVRAGVAFTRRFGEVEFSAGLDHREKLTRSYFDQGGFPVYRADQLNYDSFTPRLRVPFALAGMQHRLVAGADWYDWRYSSRRTDRPENISQPTNRVTVRQATEGYYLQDSIELTRATIATAGWRGERAKYSGDDSVDPAAPACFFCGAAPAVRQTQKQDAWELGLRHSLDARWDVFGRRGRSFRFVNAEEIYENDAFFNPQFQVLRPQNARTTEGGVEWRQAGHLLRAALFRSDISDEIHLDPFTTGVGNTNLPPSRRQGLELDGRWQASPALSLTAGYAYTDARFVEGVLPGSPFAIGTNLSVAGKEVPLVPRHKLNAGAAWDIAPRTRLSGALTAQSSQILDNDEPNTLGRRIPSFTVLDLKIAQSQSWGRLSMVLNNVFNQHYYTYAVRSAFTPDRIAVYPLPGRTIGFTAELRI